MASVRGDTWGSKDMRPGGRRRWVEGMEGGCYGVGKLCHLLTVTWRRPQISSCDGTVWPKWNKHTKKKSNWIGVQRGVAPAWRSFALSSVGPPSKSRCCLVESQGFCATSKGTATLSSASVHPNSPSQHYQPANLSDQTTALEENCGNKISKWMASTVDNDDGEVQENKYSWQAWFEQDFY